MVTAKISQSLEDQANRLSAIRVGDVLSKRSAERYIVVSENDNPFLRIDVHPISPYTAAFEEVIVWHNFVVIGFGHHAYVVSLKDRSVNAVDLESYFGHLYPSVDMLLVASSDRLYRIELDGSILWRSEILGIDGVVVNDISNSIIRGDGEWDPPGGWKPFSISTRDGKIFR